MTQILQLLLGDEQIPDRVSAKLGPGEHNKPHNVSGSQESVLDPDVADDRLARRARSKGRTSTHDPGQDYDRPVGTNGDLVLDSA
jgi:hypothetical protein